MRVFEPRYPGTWLDDTPGHEQVEPLLDQLESALADASVGLALFVQAAARPEGPPRRVQRQAAVQAIERTMQSQLAPEQHKFAAFRDIHETAELQARRQEWASGQPPESYERRLPFIHAHTVVYALDSIGKVLGVLTSISELPAAVAIARDRYLTALPNLVHVRDSAHHTEDRARGLDRRGRPLTLQPVNNGLFEAEDSFLGLSNLNYNKLGYTASDGHYREIEIGAQSVAAAQAAIQQVLDALSWHGRSRTIPD